MREALRGFPVPRDSSVDDRNFFSLQTFRSFLHGELHVSPLDPDCDIRRS